MLTEKKCKKRCADELLRYFSLQDRVKKLEELLKFKTGEIKGTTPDYHSGIVYNEPVTVSLLEVINAIIDYFGITIEIKEATEKQVIAKKISVCKDKT